MPIPDSAFATRARQLVEDVEPPFLLNHSIRAYAWAVGLARHDKVEFDAELLYVAALLHDIALLPGYDLGGCFEIEGGLAARHLAIREGQPLERAAAIDEVIALHMAAELPSDPASEVQLLWDSTGVDVTGHRLEDVPKKLVAPVLGAYPRLQFKRDFGRLFADQAARKPTCRVAEMVRTGKLEAIAGAPFEE
jgi:hypothetical protein